MDAREISDRHKGAVTDLLGTNSAPESVKVVARAVREIHLFLEAGLQHTEWAARIANLESRVAAIERGRPK